MVKCLFFTCGKEDKSENVLLYGKPLPWVDQVDHLGQSIHSSGNQEIDCRQARAKYCEISSEILRMFEFAHPLEKLTAINVYCNSWYGSMLWDLYGTAAGCAFRSWNTTAKIAWGLDRATHTYIVDHLLTKDLPSMRQQIVRRNVKFVSGLIASPNPVINLLAVLSVNTVQSNTGRNISNMKEEFQLDPLTTPS